ncbi:MAG: hypothetical protein KAT16_05785 [Candidatus Heimdallarchaeota archaeon]|nr:hypothetical protein [Candidatus Heimdallarchaeota archaeon]
MKPYITFTLEFESHVGKNTLQRDLMTICPFDHLPRKIRKIEGKNAYDIQIFFQDVEYLESVHHRLEKKSKDLEKQLNNTFSCGKVTKIEIGVVK